MYAFVIGRSSNVVILKDRIEREFEIKDLAVFWENKEIENGINLSDIPGCNIAEDAILTVVCTGKP